MSLHFLYMKQHHLVKVEFLVGLSLRKQTFSRMPNKADSIGAINIFCTSLRCSHCSNPNFTCSVDLHLKESEPSCQQTNSVPSLSRTPKSVAKTFLYLPISRVRDIKSI